MTGAGLAGIVFNHRFNSLDDLQTATADIQATVDYMRANAEQYSLDKDRICLWFYSGGGAFVATFLADRPEWLKCMAIYYGVLDPEYWEITGNKGPATQLATTDPTPLLELKGDWDPAIFIAEAGKDHPAIIRITGQSDVEF